jgi:hypothetical protein
LIAWRWKGADARFPPLQAGGTVANALKAFLAVFDGYILADIAGNRAALRELLDIEQGFLEAASPSCPHARERKHDPAAHVF